MQWLTGQKQQQQPSAPTLQYVYYPVYGKDAKGNKTAQPLYYYAVPIKPEAYAKAPEQHTQAAVKPASPAKNTEKGAIPINLEAVSSGLNLVLSNMETIIPTIIAGLFIKNLVMNNQLAVPVGHVSGGAQKLVSLLLLPPRLAMHVAGFALTTPFKVLALGSRLVRRPKRKSAAKPPTMNGSAPHANGVAPKEASTAPVKVAAPSMQAGSSAPVEAANTQKASGSSPAKALPPAGNTIAAAHIAVVPSSPAASVARAGSPAGPNTPGASTTASPVRSLPMTSSPARKFANAKGQGLGKSSLPPRRPTAAASPASRKRFVSASDNVGALGDIHINFQGFGWPEHVMPRTTDLFTWAMSTRRNIEEGKEWESYEGQSEN